MAPPGGAESENIRGSDQHQGASDVFTGVCHHILTLSLENSDQRARAWPLGLVSARPTKAGSALAGQQGYYSQGLTSQGFPAPCRGSVPSSATCLVTQPPVLCSLRTAGALRRMGREGAELGKGERRVSRCRGHTRKSCRRPTAKRLVYPGSQGRERPLPRTEVLMQGGQKRLRTLFPFFFFH